MQEIKNDLKKLCSCVLKEAGAKQLDADLIATAAKVEEKVKVMRNYANQELDNLKIYETICKINEEIENNKIKTIRSLKKKLRQIISISWLKYCSTAKM